MISFVRIILASLTALLLTHCASNTNPSSLSDRDYQQSLQSENQAKLEAATRF